MVKADGISNRGVGPQQGGRPDLNAKEAQQAKHPLGQRISQQDAARLVQQAGVQKFGAKKTKGFDVGDSSNVPIPIPDDEDTEVWTPERLDGAQQNLAMACAQLGDAAKAVDAGGDMAGQIVGSSFLPTEKGVEQMQILADRPPPEPLPLDEVSHSVKKHFDIELDDTVPTGHRLLAAGLVVAGEYGAVALGVNEKSIAGGVQKVTEKGNQAVGHAQKMSKGVNRELNLQRTFVFRR